MRASTPSARNGDALRCRGEYDVDLRLGPVLERTMDTTMAVDTQWENASCGVEEAVTNLDQICSARSEALIRT